MKSRMILVGALVFVGILLLWNFLFFAPAGKDADAAKENRATAEQEGAQLEAHLRELEKISSQAPEQKAELDKLNAAVPPTPDLEGFIRSAVDLEQQAGVDWVDIEPAEPAPGPDGASQIKMSIVVSGGFFQVLDYLNRLEQLTRLVVVDGIDVASGSTESSGSSSGTTPTTEVATGGAPNLTVTLNARMFTQAPATTTGTGTGRTGTTPSTATGGTTTSIASIATTTTGAAN